jgi:hypothetical protein
MAEVAELEVTHTTETSPSREPAPVAAEGAPPVGLSPRLSPSDHAALLASPPEAARTAAAVAGVQAAYGNEYAATVVAALRGGAAAAEPQPAPEKSAVAAAPAVTTAPAPETEVQPQPPTPAPPAPPPAPAPRGAAVAAAPAEAAPTVEGQPPSAVPEPPAPEPASQTPPELTGEAPGGAAQEASAVDAEAGGAADAAAAAAAAAEAAPAEEKPAGAEAAPGAEGKAAGPAEAGEPPAEERAPTSPEEDPAYLSVVARVKTVARQQGHNTSAQQKAKEAQAAAPGPATEVEDAAAGRQVGKIAEQEPAPFDRVKFKTALLERIEAVTPKNLKEADEFKEDNKAGAIKGEVAGSVTASKEGAAAPVKDTTQEPPATAGITPKPVEQLPPTEAGPAPPAVGAEAAAPKPKTDSEVSLAQNSAELDAAAGESDPPFTQELAEGSNEPEFMAAHQAKQDAQADAAARPATYREEEQQILAGAQESAGMSAASGTQSMHETRGEQFGAVVEAQSGTMTEDQAARQEVSQRIKGMYLETKGKVEARLAQVDTDANAAFDNGANAAKAAFENHVEQRMRAYKDERYDGAVGKLKWVKDKLLGMPSEVNVFYQEGRTLYVGLMDQVIDQVAGIVETGLNEALALVAAGRQEIQNYLATLDGDLLTVGQDAAGKMQGEFDKLAQAVRDKEGALIDGLAQKYKSNLEAVDARIAEMKAANRGLADAALDAVKGIINTLRELKNLLFGILARAAAAIGKILEDPIGFVGNLVAAVKLGLSNFVANIGTHLQEGLMAWLFGALADAGIQMPESFDLKGILSLVLQVLGLTYANIRARAVAIVGEPVVKALETAAEIFKILVTEGPAGIWEYVKDQLANLGDTILEGIKSFVIERIIMAGITWIIGLLNPAGAFIKACKAIYDIVMFFVTRASQIAAFVNAVLDSIEAIASGAIGGAAAAVENALAKAIPVVIGFLAGLLGLGGISEKIREIIKRIQAPVNAAIDWVINLAVKGIKAIGGLFGGKKDEKEEPATADPEHDAKVTAGLAAIDAEEQPLLEQGKLSHEEAERVAAKVKQLHPVFTQLAVVDGGDSWDYQWAGSAGGKKSTTAKKEESGFRGPVTIEFYHRAHHSVTEYDRQLKGQEDGLRTLKMDQWQTNRSAFLTRKAQTGSGRDPRSASLQELRRGHARINMITDAIANGLSRPAAEAAVDAKMSKEAILHNPDMVAGGMVDPTGGLGDLSINSSIGSQWRTKVTGLDDAAKQLSPEEQAKLTWADLQLTLRNAGEH